MKLCDYGCGKEAKYKLKNGKHCCCEIFNKCEAVRKRNSEKRQQQFKNFKVCPYCNKKIHINNHSFLNYDLHLISCKRKLLLYSVEKELLVEKESKYLNVYNKIIQKRFNNPLYTEYGEKHHILPRSLGGSDDLSNIIKLTAKEHYICHHLLIKIYKENAEKQHKMYIAYFKLSTKDKSFISAISYNKIRNEYSLSIKGKDLSNRKGKRWINNGKINKIVSIKEFDMYIKNGWKAGSIGNWNTNPYNKGYVWIYKNNLRKLVSPDVLQAFLDDGWLKNKDKKLSTSSKKIWVNKNNENKLILYSEINTYRCDGWVKGKAFKFAETKLKGCKLINNGNIQKFVLPDEVETFILQGWNIGGIKGLKAGIKKSFRTEEHRQNISKSLKQLK